MRLFARLAEPVLDTNSVCVSQTVAAQRNRGSPASRQPLELRELVLQHVDRLRTRRALVHLAVFTAVLVRQNQQPCISCSRVRGILREILSVRSIRAQVRILLEVLYNVRALRLVWANDSTDVFWYIKRLGRSRKQNIQQRQLRRVWVDSDALNVRKQLSARLVLDLWVRRNDSENLQSLLSSVLDQSRAVICREVKLVEVLFRRLQIHVNWVGAHVAQWT